VITDSSLLGYDATSFCTPVSGEFLPFFFADPLKLCQVGWGASLHIQRLVLKPLLSFLGCVLRVVVLLEGEPPPQSEDLSALEQVFIKDPD
jgi:hypothetical protein